MKTWQKILLMIVVLLVILVILGKVGKKDIVEPELCENMSFDKIEIEEEDSIAGVGDPDIAYNSEGTEGYMVYSAGSDGSEENGVRTNLAKTTDNGKTWKYIKTINPVVRDAVDFQGGKVIGKWVSEVPSLVYDPEDVGREWKLFYHRYFMRDISEEYGALDSKRRILQVGGVAYRYADNPEEEWSEETFLDFSDSELGRYVVYTEIGSLYNNGNLYVSLMAIRDKTSADVILLVSENHGQDWKYVGKVLEGKKAEEFGADWFTGTEIVSKGERQFLFVVPEIIKAGKLFDPEDEETHLGTLILEFEDISQGILKKEKIRYLDHCAGVSGGQATYSEFNSQGIIMFHRDLEWYPEFIKIFNTNEEIF